MARSGFRSGSRDRRARSAPAPCGVLAPDHAISVDASGVPGLTVQSHANFDRLLERAEPLPPIPTVVVCPESPDALMGALLGRDHTLIDPIFVGAREKIEAAAEEAGADISGIEIVDIPDHRAAALRSVALVHEGRARMVMKGHLHTDQLLPRDPQEGRRAQDQFVASPTSFVMDCAGGSTTCCS